MNSGKKVFFITNNSLFSRQSLADKIKKVFGIDFTLIDHIFTASYIAALYVKRNYPSAKKIYALGSAVLADELR